MSERTKRSFLNLVTSLMKSGGIMLLTFILTPLLLKYIGSANFGTFKILMEVYGTFSLLEMGQFTSMVACLMPVIKQSNQHELDDLLTEGTRRFTIVMILNIGLGIVLFPFLKSLTSWPYESTRELWITWAMIVGTAVLIPSACYRAFLYAGNEGHKINLIFLFQNTCFLIFGILFAWLGWGLKAQAMGGLISGVIGILLLKYYSGIKLKYSYNKSARFHELISRNQKPQLLNEIATKISINCDQIIIAFFTGPLVVTKIFLGQRVPLIIQGQLQSIGETSWASLGSLYYEREKYPGLFEKRVMEMNKLLSSLAIAILIPTCLLNSAFLKLWVGEDYLLGTNSLVYLSSGNAFFWSLFSFWGTLFAVLGKPNEITKMVWTQAIINIVSSLILTKLIGGVGPIAGTFISNFLVSSWCYPVLLKRHFNLPLKSTVTSLVFPGAIAVLIFTIYEVIPWKFDSLSWLNFFAYGFLIFIFFAGFFFFLFFNQEEKVLFNKRLISLWSTFSDRFK